METLIQGRGPLRVRDLTLRFSRILKIYTPRKVSFYHFEPEKLALLPLVEQATTPPDRKMIKLSRFYNLFPSLLHKTRSRVTTATSFSRQNDAGSRASTT